MHLFFEQGLQEITNICAPLITSSGADFVENSGKGTSNLFLKAIVS